VRSRIIADCWVKDEQVTEEWLVRDQAAFARCLGVEPLELARRMVAHELARDGKVAFFTPERDLPGIYRVPMESSPECEGYRRGWERIWGVKETAAIRDLYFHGAAVAIPGGEEVNGHGDIDRFCLGYLASFPDGAFKVESLFANRELGRPLRVTMRWGFDGTHAGFGYFGAPSGARVYVMGMNHAYIVDGRVTQEWIVTDEVSIWKQILAHQASRAGA
jgi:hypothetical protein